MSPDLMDEALVTGDCSRLAAMVLGEISAVVDIGESEGAAVATYSGRSALYITTADFEVIWRPTACTIIGGPAERVGNGATATEAAQALLAAWAVQP